MIHLQVEFYQQHHWKCRKCDKVIKRAMNRPPQPADCRFHRGAACTDPKCGYHTHIRNCGGEWVKVTVVAS